MKKLKDILFLILLMMCVFHVSVYADEQDVDNDIPVVYLNIDESKGTIEEMHNSSDHSVYCYGTISIDVPDGFHYVDFPDTDLSDLNDMGMSIRGRGNSTWRADKKPYKIKLDSKTDVLGLGKNKHWVLVANAYDSTLMKDRITAWLSDQLGFGFTPRGVPVDVVMSGEIFGTKYLGSYYLSENVRVDTNRLEIAELKEEDTDPDIITGGYLLQNAAQIRVGSPDRFFTDRGVDWATNTPSFDTENDLLFTDSDGNEDEREFADAYKNPAQQEYIQAYMQKAEDILFNGTTEYRDYFDIDNAARYWLINEISLNNDAYATGSTYIYKDRDYDGTISKLYWGPIWDFDFAWTHNIIYTGFSAGHKWMKPMFYDEVFVETVKNDWPEMRASLEEMIRDGGLIDQYRNEVYASAKYDHDMLNPDGTFEYDESIDKLKVWIANRIDWVDKNIDQLDDLVHRVTFVVDGEVYKYDFMEEPETVNGKEPYPKKEGYTFIGWADEDGKIVDNDIVVTKDMTFTAQYISDEDMTHATDIAFNRLSDVIRSSMMMRSYQIRYLILPEDAQDQRISWTSSDKNLASVTDDGFVQYYGTGTVTFTARSDHGIDRSFTLTILESGSDPYPYPEKIFPEQEVINMEPGEQSPFIIEAEPIVSKIYDYEYVSDDTDVVEVGEYGVLSAKAPGTTKVHVRVRGVRPIEDTNNRALSEGEEDFYLETYVTVIVSDKKPEPTPEPTPTPEPAPTPKPAPKPEQKTVYKLPLTGIE